ncbi:hypothetical protein OB955_20440 [Halobacteria archaeon AArc-m2/3/4]|uniref:Uncharacterized protein n=1 Tax=Natronoglomus mannanivorans TaxID=2979990 RepID=A0AAP2Z402_9EURY|nr:hypothetical protein [Halobacteria archaeon AArc-xg1-1]MCU4975073.1 hypothetical protein [Halobacteria archaeon AArc-m2/3/4]
MTPNDPGPHDVSDGGQLPVDELHEALLEAKQELRELETQLPEPLTLSESIRELNTTTDAYARFGSDYHDDSE